MMTRIMEFLATQAWFQELKTKWEQLDSSQQLIVRAGSAALAGIALLSVIIGFGVSSYQLKNELKDKQELLKLLSQAVDEIKPQNAEADSTASSQGIQWKRQLDALFGSVAITTPQVEWKEEKRIASTNPTQLETWLEFKLNDIDLKQLVRLSVNMEVHQPPLKIRLLEIDSTKSRGKLAAHIAVSGFEVKQ